MSHYNPNGSVSKTLIQHLIRFAAESGDFPEAREVLHAVVATEISPELVPAGADGKGQSTEAVVGPYALQDFNLFYLTRYGFAPSKIAYLAWRAWRDADAGDWPKDILVEVRRAYGPHRDQALAGPVPEAFLRQPVQALRHVPTAPRYPPAAPVAPRRLAHALGRQPRGVAGRAGGDVAGRPRLTLLRRFAGKENMVSHLHERPQRQLRLQGRDAGGEARPGARRVRPGGLALRPDERPDERRRPPGVEGHDRRPPQPPARRAHRRLRRRHRRHRQAPGQACPPGQGAAGRRKRRDPGGGLQC